MASPLEAHNAFVDTLDALAPEEARYVIAHGLGVLEGRTQPNAEDLELAGHVLKNLDQMRVHDPGEAARVGLATDDFSAEMEKR